LFFIFISNFIKQVNNRFTKNDKNTFELSFTYNTVNILTVLLKQAEWLLSWSKANKKID